MKPAKQATNNEKKVAHLAPFQWQPGQSGNPKGRTPQKSMKEHVREMLERMTVEERDAFLIGMPKEVIWKMAEGNPHTTEDKKVEISVPTPILGGASQAHHIAAKEIVEELTEGENDFTIHG
jgi:hypothetical protein